MTPDHTSTPSALFTDLYELTMLRAYFEEGLNDTAVFSLFVRRLPPNRNVLLACGLDSVLTYLEALHFTDDDVEYLRSLPFFSEPFLTWLRRFRFEGDVYAVPEGTPIFANEPILEIVAPVTQGQLVETYVMNHVHVQTVLASKALRVVAAAQGRPVIDFGARRAHGVDAALSGARAFYIAGVQATSNVLAGHRYGIPVAGTMAHSYIQAHGGEQEAFESFARIFPDTVLLVDTYDTLEGVRRIIALAKRAPGRFTLGAVRLDSGELGALARETRRLLDGAGLQKVRIFASSGLDEHEIAELLTEDAPIDAFGVGTGMSVSSDAPTLDIAYKLCEYGGQGRTKLSENKPVLPGRKQVFRREQGGQSTGDVIGRFGEQLEGRPLLRLVMRQGKRVSPAGDSLESARRRAAEDVARLPRNVTALDPADPPYRVDVSEALQQHHAGVRRSVMTL